jgi:hypothetical protein
MSAVEIAEHARALLDAYGDKAEAHAAKKASELRARERQPTPTNGPVCASMISEMRGSHVS